MKRWQEHIISLLINIFTFGGPSMNAAIHRSQNKSYYLLNHRKATYKEFKSAFLKADWVCKLEWSNSLFHKEQYDRNMIHAGIIRIDGICYNLTSYGYMRAKKLVQTKINKIRFN